ncbi:MAG: Hsp33 family molecular chaperone HslO [Eubacteriales bacterium]
MAQLIKTLINLDAVVVACDTTDICEHARQIHGLTYTTSAVLGRALTAAIIMGNSLKNADTSVTLNINGGGPAGTVITVSNSECEVKGYVTNPAVSLPLNDKGK